MRLLKFFTLRFYFFLLFIVYLFSFSLYLQRNPVESKSDIIILLLPVLELFLIYVIANQLSVWRIFFTKIICFIFVFFASSIFIIQCISVYMSNAYITPLALGNIDSSQFLQWKPLAAGILINGLLISLAIYARSKANYSFSIIKTIIIAIFAGFYIYCMSNQMPAAGTYIAENQSPVKSFIDAGLAHYQKSLILKKYQSVENINDFPFLKSYVYKQPLPFNRKNNQQNKKNIIVFFVEGTSNRLLGCYGSPHDGLTPNIDSIAMKSLKIDNYFNHTAATFRGLRGQFMSGYQEVAGSRNDGTGWSQGNNIATFIKSKNNTLINMLNKHGYDTFFLSPHTTDLALNIMLRSLDFTKVITKEDVVDNYLKGERIYEFNFLADKELIMGLNAFLKERTESQQDERPFFISIYNFGTHLFQESPDKQHFYKDGKNPVLNRMHTFDAHFKLFLDYFFSSDLHKTTLLMITSDHTTFPEPDYKKVAGDDLVPVFVDKIPFIIYDENIDFPQTFNAIGRNTLDFTPTLLQILGINNEDNAFLGCSVFEQCKGLNISAIDDLYFITDEDGIHFDKKIPEQYLKEFEDKKIIIHNYFQSERNGTLFPE